MKKVNSIPDRTITGALFKVHCFREVVSVSESTGRGDYIGSVGFIGTSRGLDVGLALSFH